MRDTLLFEDQSYSNSKTLFWALQSLRIVNECLDSLITAWELHDKSSILDLLLDDAAGDVDNGPQKCSYVDKIERQMEQLRLMIKKNNAWQEDIRTLRDGVSSGFLFPSLPPT